MEVSPDQGKGMALSSKGFRPFQEPSVIMVMSTRAPEDPQMDEVLGQDAFEHVLSNLAAAMQ